MSIWDRIADALRALAAGEPLSEIFARLRTPPERTVAFTIAVISLGAKMAKADGQVTRNEIRAFREIFSIPKEDEPAAARVFDLARQDIAGFDVYARRIGRMFGDDMHVKENLLEGLFHIAVADSNFADPENEFLQIVAREMGVSDRMFRTIRARYVPGCAPDPFTVLGVDPDTDIEDIRSHWRKLVRETHPDQLMAHGVPEEAIKLATHRLTAINRAWDEVQELQRAG